MSASDAERKLLELSFLHEVAQLASSARDWDEMLRIVIGRTTDAMGAEVSSLYLLERSDGLLRLVATNGLNRGGIGRATPPVGEGVGARGVLAGAGRWGGGGGASGGWRMHACLSRRATYGASRAGSGSRRSTRSA